MRGLFFFWVGAFFSSLQVSLASSRNATLWRIASLFCFYYYLTSFPRLFAFVQIAPGAEAAQRFFLTWSSRDWPITGHACAALAPDVAQWPISPSAMAIRMSLYQSQLLLWQIHAVPSATTTPLSHALRARSEQRHPRSASTTPVGFAPKSTAAV